MNIYLTSGIGTGPTELAALDNALHKAGVGNLNLIPLSSVIPKGAQIVKQKIPVSESDWGKRIFVVIAKKTTSKIGRTACAGLGWIISPKDGAGLFVEHVGSSEKDVRSKITASLGAMREYRREKFGKINHEIALATCRDKPVCALVCTAYKIEQW